MCWDWRCIKSGYGKYQVTRGKGTAMFLQVLTTQLAGPPQEEDKARMPGKALADTTVHTLPTQSLQKSLNVITVEYRLIRSMACVHEWRNHGRSRFSPLIIAFLRSNRMTPEGEELSILFFLCFHAILQRLQHVDWANSVHSQGRATSSAYHAGTSLRGAACWFSRMSLGPVWHT